MGQAASSSHPFSNKIGPSFDVDVDDQMDAACRARQLELAVAHYMPATFPLVPVVNKSVLVVCKQSWNVLMAQNDPESNLIGITMFYTEFYELLDKFDSTGRFDAVLTRNTTGMNKIAAKGAILLRIIQFVLSLDVENGKQTNYSLHMLGKSHSHKQIRPWQYSVFIQTLLNTIALRLGAGATHEVMCAWVNVFAFVMKSMLPPAIKGQVVETELSANVATTMNEDSAKQLEAVEEVRQLRKRLGEGTIRSHSAYSRQPSAAGLISPR